MKYFLLFFSMCLLASAQTKINGVSFVASNNEITTQAIQPIVELNANWITLMPFGFMKTENDTAITFNSQRQWINERKEGIEKTVKLFKQKKIKIMLKPQIWIPKGGFTGHIRMNTENEWKLFESSYEKFILFYTKIAEENNCELFCIGTEMNFFVTTRSGYWNRLIAKIKKLYSGKITYAENWDTYKTVPFIESLDYIGIDAYFPLNKTKSPSVNDIEKAWKPLKGELKQWSNTHNKKILFTEYGYQSKDFSTSEPWNFSKKAAPNMKIQENALIAIYNQFWSEDWMAGGFLWKWYDNDTSAGGINNTDYTVQNKPAQKIVKRYYTKKQKSTTKY